MVDPLGKIAEAMKDSGFHVGRRVHHIQLDKYGYVKSFDEDGDLNILFDGDDDEDTCNKDDLRVVGEAIELGGDDISIHSEEEKESPEDTNGVEDVIVPSEEPRV